MKKQNYSTLTSYLSKTKRIQISTVCITLTFQYSVKIALKIMFFILIIFPDIWWRKEIFWPYLLSIPFSLIAWKKDTIKAFTRFLKEENHDTFYQSFSFRGCNIIYTNKKAKWKRSHGFLFHGSMTRSLR